MQRVIPWACVFYLVSVLFFYTVIRMDFDSREFGRYYDSKKYWVGIIVDDPDRGLEQTKIVVKPEGFTEKILLKLPQGIDLNYGDRISFTATIQKPESFITDTGRMFNYPAYLAVKNIYATAQVFEVTLRERHQGFFIIEQLYRCKKYVVEKIVLLFPKNEAGLLAGIVIGEQSLLPKDVYAHFQLAGLTHIIVLSGYNITLVAMAITGLLAMVGCGYRWRRWGAIAVIPFFIIMTGINASSVRAGCMTILVLLLQITTRTQESWRVILFTLTGIVITNPLALLHDPSLHLSFLAFIGLVYASPVVRYLTAMMPGFLGLREFVFETLAVQIFVLPYILYMSGVVSGLILISNMVTTPLVPFIMMSTGAVFVLELVIPGLASPIVAMVELLLSYVIRVAVLVAQSTWAIIEIPPFSIGIMLGIYGVFTYVIYMVHRKMG